MGQIRLQAFVEERLQLNSAEFMAQIQKQPIRTFRAINKTMKVKTHGKIELVNINRQI